MGWILIVFHVTFRKVNMGEINVFDGKNTVEKWDKTGLLEATKESDKQELADKLERLAQVLVNYKSIGAPNMEEVAGIILPILVRMYNERRDVCPTDMEKFYKEFVKDYDSHKALIDDLNSYISQDGEREFCALYVESYKG